MNQKLLNISLFVLLSLIWGSSFILIKLGLKSLDPYQLASLRILFAGLVVLPMGVRSYKAIPAEKRLLVVVSGVIGTFFPAYLFCIAETRIDSSLAGILNALTPIFTLAIGTTMFSHHSGWKQWGGVVLGFAGLAALLISDRPTVQFENLGYSSFILLATLCYGINVNMINHHLKGVGSRDIASVAFSMLIIPALVILWQSGYFDLPWNNAAFALSSVAGMMLGIIGTAAASVLFYMLLKRAGPVFASMVTYGIPFVAIFWGLVAGEGVNTIQIACLSVILCGVYMANR